MISPTAAKDMLNTLGALFNSYHISIASGSIPADCGASFSGTTLSDAMTFGATAFGSATDGGSNGIMTITANAIASDTNAAASGTAGYFRCSSGAGSGTVVAQGTCGTSTADMIMNTTTITAGDTIACSSFVITLPDGSGVD